MTWILANWRLLAALILAGILALQVVARRHAEAQLDAFKAQVAQQSAKSEAQAAKTGQEALTAYVDRTSQDRPVVERVVERVRNVCLRPAGDLPVPSGAGAPDAVAAGPGDDADRAFAEAAARDLALCAGELERFRALQEWKRANGG